MAAPDWLNRIAGAAATAGATELNAALGLQKENTDEKRGADVTQAKEGMNTSQLVVWGGVGVAVLVVLWLVLKKR